MKKIGFIILLFFLFTGLMLFRKGLLTPKNINLLERKFFPGLMGKNNLSLKEEKKITPEEKQIIQALDNLQKEREKINQEKERLNKLKERLLAQEEELKKKVDEIVLLKKNIDDSIKKLKLEQDNKIKWFARVYSQMPPEQVAPIIEKLNDELALQILSQIDDRQVGKIIAAMGTNQAVKLTQKIEKLLEK